MPCVRVAVDVVQAEGGVRVAMEDGLGYVAFGVVDCTPPADMPAVVLDGWVCETVHGMTEQVLKDLFLMLLLQHRTRPTLEAVGENAVTDAPLHKQVVYAALDELLRRSLAEQRVEVVA